MAVPDLPKAPDGKMLLLSAATWNEIRSELMRCAPVAGSYLEEVSMGEQGTRLDANVGSLVTVIERTIYGNDYDPTGVSPLASGLSGKLTGVNDQNGFHFNYQPDPAGDPTTYYEVASLYITNGVITAYEGG